MLRSLWLGTIGGARLLLFLLVVVGVASER